MTVINCDKYPANCCVIFYGSEVISVFNFVVGYLRVMRVVRQLSVLIIKAVIIVPDFRFLDFICAINFCSCCQSLLSCQICGNFRLPLQTIKSTPNQPLLASADVRKPLSNK
jgi:hypothetical protein